MRKTISLLFALCICFVMQAQVPPIAQVPSTLLGNWINETTNDWEYGFFEEFAIYQCGFWEYESINTQGKKTTLVLRQGGELATIEATHESNGTIGIKHGKQKKRKYALMQKQYPAYKAKDTTPFPALELKQDSATIIGYYRNLNNIPEQNRKELASDAFELVLFDPLIRRQRFYHANIDSQGRFSITVPLYHTQEALVSRYRMGQTMILQPNDTLFLFADLADFIPEEGMGYEHIRDKQVLYMGRNARLNNELLQYQWSEQPNDMLPSRQISETNDMELLRKQEQTYRDNIQHLDAHIARHPALSTRFISYIRDARFYALAYLLMERHRDKLYRNDARDPRFEEGYMDYIYATFFPLDYGKFYTFSAQLFLQEYIRYLYTAERLLDYELVIQLTDILIAEEQSAAKMKPMNDQLRELLGRRTAIRNDSLHKEIVLLFDKKMEVARSLNFSEEQILQKLGQLANQVELSLADSLFTTPAFRELNKAAIHYDKISGLRLPLPPGELQDFQAQVTNAYLRQRVIALHDYYYEIEQRLVKHADCLKSADHLASIEDADELLEQIIAPYKGKHIVIDFWDSWSSPITKDVSPEAQAIDEVVFIFLTYNSSPEEIWRKHIKEKNLLGENVVHYRLPPRQLKLLMHKFSIAHAVLPACVRINREGEIETLNVSPDPEDSERHRVIVR